MQGGAAPFSRERFARKEAEIEAFLDRAGVPAFALGIVQGEELVFARGFGVTRLDAAGAPVTEESLFPTCSTGKTLTGTALMRLVEQGLLDLDRPVLEYVPWLRYPEGGDVARVTLRHLLSHTSGLSSDPEVPVRLRSGDPKSLEEHVREDVPGFSAIAPPGRVLWYSNPGFSIAGCIAEVVTGERYRDLMQRLVFDPLGMAHTSFDPALARSPALVRTHTTEGDGTEGDGPPQVREDYPPFANYPAGGGVTTLVDLSRFAMACMNESRSVLAPGTLAEMQRPHGDGYCRDPRRYGLGFDLERHRGLRLVTHGGGGGGYGTTFVMAPDVKTAVIAMFSHPGGYAIRARSLLDAILGLEPEPEPPPFEPDRSRLAALAGSWERARGVPFLPRRVSIEASERGLTLDLGERRRELRPVDENVWETSEGWTAGFVPEPGGQGPQYLMLNLFTIGLVSVVPYRRLPA